MPLGGRERLFRTRGGEREPVASRVTRRGGVEAWKGGRKGGEGMGVERGGWG